MKRRNFFGAFAGLVAAPVAAKAISEIKTQGELLEMPEQHVVQKKALGPVYHEDFSDCSSMSGGYWCTAAPAGTLVAFASSGLVAEGEWDGNDDEEDEDY